MNHLFNTVRVVKALHTITATSLVIYYLLAKFVDQHRGRSNGRWS